MFYALIRGDGERQVEEKIGSDNSQPSVIFVRSILGFFRQILLSCGVKLHAERSLGTINIVLMLACESRDLSGLMIHVVESVFSALAAIPMREEPMSASQFSACTCLSHDGCSFGWFPSRSSTTNHDPQDRTSRRKLQC